ncbi:hypothetical protein ALC57_16072 [Trachymyrmex cornetzi]|uniref:MADF domain-containing protein n=1 Tax=Trachymyrmex cornetzi TaxID=471704 RepID=A0A151IVM1_9HYME|nr:hypothetical protein ALC57_16072 [Trachymyrmex cornetzi]
MSLKWNENVILIFLNAYQKHPCLWNPYYVKYYDCLAKNDALKNIIKELNIPELNISDCLEQIKLIRKKYGQEQIRVIKGFQSGKLYESPFAWFPIMVEMLTKVIDDESKLQNRTVKMLSPVKDCITIPYDNNSRYKNVSNFSCMQDYKTKSRKNRNFEHESEGQSNTQLLQCPSCGWEDINPNKLDIKTVKTTYENIKPLNTVPCPEYSNLANKLNGGYKAHRIIDNMYQGKYENIISCPTFSSGLPSYTGYSTDISKTNYIYYPQSTCNYINQQMKQTTPVAIVASKPKFCTRKTQLSSKQLFPERQTKQVGTIIEQYNKGIQNTVYVSKGKTDIVQKCYREIQSKPLTSQEVSKQVAVNTVEQCDKEIQNTICASPSNCQVFQIYSSTQEVKPIDANTMKCPTNDMRNTIGIKLKIVEGSMPNFILITTDGNYLSLIQRDLEEFTTNKCQKDTASEVTVCEQIPSKFLNENIHSDTSSAAELESLSCLPCLEKTEKDNTIAMFTETLLEIMKHAFVMNNWSKRQILNKLYCRSKSKSTCPLRKNSALNSNQTQDIKEDVVDHFTTYANSKDVEVLYEPSTSKIRDYSLSENDTTYAETTMDEPFVKDKDVTASTENHDIGLNISLPQILLRDSETQYTPKQLQDTGIVTDPNFEEKISVATQNREPILIRVIKSNNSGDILKLDKETCVRDAHVLWNVDKYSKNMYQKYSVRKLLHSGISHVCEKEVNCIDYRTSLLRTVPNPSNGIYRYYKECRSSLPCHHDWIKANITNLGISSIQRVSRIPLYARSRKYTQRRTDLYRMSRSYV